MSPSKVNNSTIRALNHSEVDEISNNELKRIRSMINEIKKDKYKNLNEFKEDTNKQLNEIKENSNRQLKEIRKQCRI
jgi:F0F1-type ATP synthase membrane subunit b/b'